MRLSLLALSILASPSPAQELYAVTGAGELALVDPADPSAVTVVGSLGLPPGTPAWGLAHDPGTDLLLTIAVTGAASTDRDYCLATVDRTTGAATIVGLLMDSTVTGHIEGFEYVHHLGGPVIAHSDGGAGDFHADHYALVDPANAGLTPLSSSVLDSDAAAYSPLTGTFYSLDPNGTDWARVDLVTGGHVAAGAAVDTIGDVTFRPGTNSAYGNDFNNNVLYRFDLDATGQSFGAATTLGTIAGAQVTGLTFVSESTLGAPFCAAAPNSTGRTGQLIALGSAAVADDAVTLAALSLPPSAFGFFLASRTAAFVPNPGGSTGNLCLGGDIGRYVGPGQIQNSGPLGAFSLGLALGSVPQPTGPVAVLAGETWNFQAWHRDLAAGGPTSNFTPGLELTFL